MTEYQKAKQEIIKALRALDKAATALRDSYEFNNPGDMFHSSTVADYKRITTAAEILNKIY